MFVGTLLKITQIENGIDTILLLYLRIIIRYKIKLLGVKEKQISF